MEEMYAKILELWNVVKKVPEECKGNSKEASKNRRAWMYVRSTIYPLIREEDK